VRPFHLPPNQLHRFYKGGARIAALRNSGSDDPYSPEEWIASMTSPFGEPDAGISALVDGSSLAEAVSADPEAFLGPEHLARFGPDVAVLIKLLDAGERLPVHFHPNDDFAQRHLGSRYGKTEAWIILEAFPGASVHVGFQQDVSRGTVADWVGRQDVASMLTALCPVTVTAGTTVFVPAGTPHAIGEGILLAELQQPTDFSVLMEWEGFAIDGPQVGHLGLGFDTALGALDRSPWTGDDLDRALSDRGEARPGVETLFPLGADPFFRAERIRGDGTTLDRSFSVLLVTDGRGLLLGDGWELRLSRGDAVLVPHAAGGCALTGGADVIRCMPPDPSAAS
jgi:mannose-6-phosphate isomerase